jgi:glutathione peroxidase
MLKFGVAIIVILAIGIFAAAYFYGFILNPSPTDPPNEKSLYEFTLKDIDGTDVKFDTYKGKVLLIVNVASKCGLTPQYDQLGPLYQKYKDKGLVILGFPANNYMGQEPGTEKEIKEFCRLKYDVSFPMFSKISVKGKDQHPFYTFLTNEKSNPGFSGDVSWNFEKFLIGKDGKTLARFSPRTVPNDVSVIEAIEKALN